MSQKKLSQKKDFYVAIRFTMSRIHPKILSKHLSKILAFWLILVISLDEYSDLSNWLISLIQE